MAKRRAEGALLLHDSPAKRCCRALCGVDLRLGSMGPAAGGVSPPSLLALLGSRSRKRPHYFEETQPQDTGAAPHREASACDVRTHAADVAASGSFPERRSSSGAAVSSKKRPREDCATPGTVSPGDKADEDTNTYNSFQYWRTPLPELDLSLLEDDSQTEARPKAKDSSSDAMET